MFPPDLIDGVGDFLTAFWELSTDRPSGFGPGPIPFTSIDAYARRHGIDDPDEFALFSDLIREMDRAYLDKQREKTEKKKP